MALEKVLSHILLKYPEIREVSVFGLSLENLRRPREELDDLFEVQTKYFIRLYENPLIYRERVRVRVLGFTELLPSHLLKAISKVENATRSHDNRYLNFLMPYGGQQEIVRAVSIASSPLYGPLALLNPKSVLESSLFVSTPVDLIIRTAEKRLSNFLLYQSAYAEIVFVDKYWPSFTVEDFDMCINEFRTRRRKYGYLE